MGQVVSAPVDVVSQPVAGPPPASLSKRLAREAVVMIALWILYSVGRAIAANHTGAAFGNADQVWAFQRWLHLPDERDVQGFVLQWPDLVRAANGFYASAHFPGTALCLVWLFIMRPVHYTWIRRVLVTLTALALIGHFFYPLAPPRMMSRLGFFDTGMIYGQSVYGAPGGSVANQYAAMPSLHVGWAVLVAIAVIAAGRSRWRWLVLLHPVVTLLVVVATANHYWLDGIVAVAMLGAVLLVVPRPPQLGSARALVRLCRRNVVDLRDVPPSERDAATSSLPLPAPRGGA